MLSFCKPQLTLTLELQHAFRVHFCVSQLLLHNEQPQNTQWYRHSFSRVWTVAAVTRLPWAQLAALHQAAGLAALGWESSVCVGFTLSSSRGRGWKGKGVTLMP